MREPFTITWNGRQLNVNGLPEAPIRTWDDNIKIKFYHRGKYSYPVITPSGKFKRPREETQIYINGKYFLQLIWNTTEENEEIITGIIKYLYCYGCDLDEVKRILKKAFYQQK